MKKRRTKNTRLTSDKERRKQFIIKSVVKRGSNATWRSVSRWSLRVVKLLLIAGLLGAVYWGATEGYRRLFWENPDYALKEVRVSTDGALTDEQVIKAAGLLRGRNIFAYKLDAAREAIRALPQVESAEIRRYLPNRIELTIKERKPVAWVTASREKDPNQVERTHLIGAGGMIFKPKQMLAQYQALPVIFGVPVGDLPSGRPVLMAEVSTALDLLQRVRASGDFHIVSMDISKGYCVIVTDQRGTKITFGLDDLPGQLTRLTDVQREAGQIGQDLATVNVMVARNIPVTFMPQPARQTDVEELLGEPSEKDAPRPRVVSPPDPDGKAGKSSPKKSEPTKSKEPSRRESEPLLRPFRRV
jgi:hypothetical protein